MPKADLSVAQNSNVVAFPGAPRLDDIQHLGDDVAALIADIQGALSVLDYQHCGLIERLSDSTHTGLMASATHSLRRLSALYQSQHRPQPAG